MEPTTQLEQDCQAELQRSRPWMILAAVLLFSCATGFLFLTGYWIYSVLTAVIFSTVIFMLALSVPSLLAAISAGCLGGLMLRAIGSLARLEREPDVTKLAEAIRRQTGFWNSAGIICSIWISMGIFLFFLSLVLLG